MFGVSKEELIKGLENLRKRVCCYGGDTPCDCKYGIPEKKDGPLSFLNSDLGEQVGCPELRQVINILKSMSSKDFSYHNKSSGMEITDDVFIEKLNNALKGEYEIVDKNVVRKE